MKEREVFCPSIPPLLLSFCAIFNLRTNYSMISIMMQAVLKPDQIELPTSVNALKMGFESYLKK
jgi:hypothetical protein